MVVHELEEVGPDREWDSPTEWNGDARLRREKALGLDEGVRKSGCEGGQGRRRVAVAPRAHGTKSRPDGFWTVRSYFSKRGGASRASPASRCQQSMKIVGQRARRGDRSPLDIAKETVPLFREAVE